MPERASEPHFYIDPARAHLGGYIVGGDDATFYPDLWTWLVKERGASEIIDVGCGEGYACGFFVELGCGVVGIDGVNQVPTWEPAASFITHDYTTGPLDDIGSYDLCWSCEFVEHVEERYVPNFLATFACADVVLMTHAEPGQLGHHHVNCQPASYWQGAMAAIGYELDSELTDQTRVLAAMNRNPYNHFARSGLAFVRQQKWPDDYRGFGSNVQPKRRR